MNYLLDTHVFLWMLADPSLAQRKGNENHPKILIGPFMSVQ
jgi:PIN domain nuclease of toxin-antitoxin system